MFNTEITKNYQLLDATFEILIMLAGAFLLGALFCWAMGKLRGNKNNRKAPYLRKTVDHQNGFRQPVQQAGVTYPVVNEKSPKKVETIKSAIIKSPSGSLAKVNTATEGDATVSIAKTAATTQDRIVITDDFKKIEGIGLQIENTLYTAGVKTYADLRAISYDALKEILRSGNLSINLHDPETWPYQADLAYNNKWGKLKQYQDFLTGGKKTS